jgi:hypothetical protein
MIQDEFLQDQSMQDSAFEEKPHNSIDFNSLSSLFEMLSENMGEHISNTLINKITFNL